MGEVGLLLTEKLPFFYKFLEKPEDRMWNGMILIGTETFELLCKITCNFFFTKGGEILLPNE